MKSETAERICAKSTRKTCLVLARKSLKVKVKGKKVKVTRDKKRNFSALLADCVQFMFGKTALASTVNSMSN